MNLYMFIVSQVGDGRVSGIFTILDGVRGLDFSVRISGLLGMMG